MPQYDPYLHTTAERELNAMSDTDRDRLTSVLKAVAECREPTQHEAARHLEGQPDLFRVRAGDTRAICKLAKPHLLILSCGYRKNVYDKIDEIDSRLDAVA